MASGCLALKHTLVLIVVLVLALLLGGLMLPSTITVERSIPVARPAATVFTLLNGFSSYRYWLPWVNIDPAASLSLSGPERGPGARLSWSGDPALVGHGWQEIVASEPHGMIALQMEIGDQGLASSEYRIEGDQVGSLLTWTFSTDVTEGQGFFGGLLGRYFGLFLKAWVSKDYERGLANFKAYAEQLPAADFSKAEIEQLQVEPVTVLQMAGNAAADGEAIAAALAQAYDSIMAEVARVGVVLDGQPMAISRNLQSDAYDFIAAIPVSADSIPVDTEWNSPVQLAESPGGKAVRVVHRGSYADTLRSYEQAGAWMAAHGLSGTGLSWEHYISDPGSTAEDELVTYLYFLLADPAE